MKPKFFFRKSVCTAVSCLGLYCVGSGWSQLALAQTAADSAARQAEQIQRDRAADEFQKKVERNRLNNQPPGGDSVPAPQHDIAAPNEACIHVKTISVAGISLLQTRAVNSVIAGFEKRCLGLADLNNILKELTFLYVDKGYITSRAFLPEQDLSDGSLEIVVVEGVLESIVLDGEPDTHNGQVKTAFPDLVGKPVNLRDIEQGLDQLNRLRSNDAKIELEAGTEPGSSALQVARNKSKNWYASVGFNNLGSSSTGIYQSRIDAGFEDVMGLNDQWTFSYQRSMDNHPLYFANVPGGETFTGSFSIPYGYWTFALDGLWSEYNSQIAGPISSIDTAGLSRSFGASLSRVLHRDQVSITSLSGNIKWKRNENFILGTRIDVASRDLAIGSLELVHSRQFFGGQLVASASYNQGLDIWGVFDDDSAPAGSPKGQFKSVNGSITYLKPLQIGDLSATYNGQLTGQYSPDLLFGSEQVAYGGYSTVRGLRESVVFGNNGVLARNEFALKLPNPDNPQFTEAFGSLEAYAAVDFGQVFAEESLGIEGGNLAGATIGLRSRGGKFVFDISWSDVISATDNIETEIGSSGMFNATASIAF